MVSSKLILLLCIAATFAWQPSSAVPAGDFRFAKVSTTTTGPGDYVCIRKVDFDAMTTLAAARENADRYKRKMGPEVIFEVE